jgi:hypothetical protein
MKNLRKAPNIHKAANVLFDSEKISAWSYNWWQFVKVVNGKTVFNAGRYSNSTSKHQSKVRVLMGKLNIKIDVTVYINQSLNNVDIEKLTIKQLIAESNRQIAERDAARKERAKELRIRKRLESMMPLYHPTGELININREASILAGGN